MGLLKIETRGQGYARRSHVGSIKTYQLQHLSQFRTMMPTKKTMWRNWWLIQTRASKSLDEKNFISKLAPAYKEYVLAKEPATFQEANNLAVALWRRRHPEGVPLKPNSIFAVESEFGLNQNLDLSQEEWELCTNTIREKRNNGQNFQQNRGFSNYSNNLNNGNKQQSKPKKYKKKKENGHTAIKCWFSNKTGHTQLECRTRKAQNKPLTWRNKEVKSKYHSNKVLAITDLEDLEELQEWRHKIEEEAKLMELWKTRIFSNGFYQAPHGAYYA